MPKYETMLVTSAKLDEEQAVALRERFIKLIEKNGTVDAVDEWGKRRLAYPINKEEDGIYTLIHFTSDTDFPKELYRRYGITDGVLRSLIIAKEDDAEIPAPAAKPAEKAEAAAPVAEATPAAEAAPATEAAPAQE